MGLQRLFIICFGKYSFHCALSIVRMQHGSFGALMHWFGDGGGSGSFLQLIALKGVVRKITWD